jgi:hypothetical protein
MFRIFLVAVVIASGLFAVKDGRVLKRAGLTGSCSAVATPRGQTGFWQACRPGRLEGQPDLSRRSCTAAGARGEIAYWRCPTRVESSPLRP